MMAWHQLDVFVLIVTVNANPFINDLQEVDDTKWRVTPVGA
jgi:hypothetical protein